MKWENIIQEDRIKSVSPDFTEQVMSRLTGLRKYEFRFRKRYLGMSIAAGIIMGMIMLGLQHHLGESRDRDTMLKEWIGQYHLDDMNLEKMDINLF
ncbi:MULTISPECIES: hypothetical protein [Butyricimonas]|uniref:hypothetical protein n=1 Tax=Butyricimonas TaxID=574697 RepID=UPI001D08A659|nr:MULTISPECIES: hypothetical protein [Butyricimonas]MCB6974297.1 hypothetical protein [Butyricimonas synergistica]MCG4521143.1 hypothetical protein [Butyricimonas sp. DFI.6.44]